MKQDGLDYHERMEELEKLEYPKPNREFIYSTFNAFAERHPWVGQENIRPKSIAREMFEEFRSFADYVKLYDLQRAEGVLLRHLSGVHKVLVRTVPDAAKNDAVREMELYLGAMLRQVDSSLLEAWERFNDPHHQPPGEEAPEMRPPGWEAAASDITRNKVAFTAGVRTRVFAFLRALASADCEAALLAVPAGAGEAEEETAWTAERLQAALDEYLAEHERIRLDPEARNERHTYTSPSEDKHTWHLQQMLVDPDEHNDWAVDFRVDLDRSREKGEPVVAFCRLAPLIS
jgi:hypothetical protein